MNQDSHVKLFEKIIFEIELKRSGFCKNLKYFEDYHEPSANTRVNFRLKEFLQNSAIEFYNGEKPYKKRYE